MLGCFISSPSQRGIFTTSKKETQYETSPSTQRNLWNVPLPVFHRNPFCWPRLTIGLSRKVTSMKGKESNQNTFRHGFLGKRNKNKDEKESTQGLGPRENDKIKKKGENNNFRPTKISIKGEESTVEEQQEKSRVRKRETKSKGENWQ